MELKLLVTPGGPVSENFKIVIPVTFAVCLVCYILLRIFKTEMSELKRSMITGVVTAVTGILLTIIFPPV